jgi:hypothetical protein
MRALFALPLRESACGPHGIAWRGRGPPSCDAADIQPREPSLPRALSTMVTRTLRVPKSAPAKMAMSFLLSTL